MSLPDTKALSPYPLKIATRILGLFARLSQIFFNSWYIGQVNALRAAGLLNVIWAKDPLITKSRQGAEGKLGFIV